MKQAAVPLLLFASLLFLQAANGDTLHEALANPNSAWSLAQSNTAELLRRAEQNEMANSYGRRPPMRYTIRKITQKSDVTKQVVETPTGGVARLIAVGGNPLSAEQNRQEIERLQTLNADPSLEAHRREREQRDAQRSKKIMRLLPTAFLYQSAGTVKTADGTMIRVRFAPNPKFSPPDFESRVLTGIRGEAWIDPQDLRIVHIQANIFKPVDFGWGIIGSLYPGATLTIEQTKTPACGWQLAHLVLHLQGKELMLKPLHVVVEETASEYAPVPRKWTYKDAIAWLLQMPLTQTGR